MIHAVRCTNCQNLSRVASEVIGRVVACPHCRESFTAVADPTFAPAIQARPRVARRVPSAVPPSRAPVVGRVVHDSYEVLPGPPPVLLGMALLPIGIPLFWLAARVITGQAPVFSYAAPVAIAIGLSTLSFGIVFAHGMSFGTKLKAILALALLGYMLGGFVFFMKKEWAEVVRKNLGGPPKPQWREFKEENTYSVFVPGEKTAVEEQIPGWTLKGYRFSNLDQNRNDGLDLAYEIATGKPPAELNGKDVTDEDWFRAARKAIVEKCDGQVIAEKLITHQGLSGREFTLTLPDGATNKVVRVFRFHVKGSDRAYYLAVEGVFLPVEAKFVSEFFNSLKIIEPTK